MKINIIAAISGRQELKTARSFYKPAEFDINAVIEKMQAPPDYVEEVQAKQEIVKDEASLDEIEVLIEKIKSLSINLNLSIPENKKWNDLYQAQGEKFASGQIDDQRFTAVLRRYLKYLEESKLD